MDTLIRLNNGEGPLVEVALDVPVAQLASAGTVIKVVEKNFGDILGTLRSIVVPLSESWDALSKDVSLSESTVKLSLGITAEGNFFVAKGSAEAHLEIEVTIKPRPGA